MVAAGARFRLARHDWCLYCVDVTHPILRFDEVAPGLEYHAALVRIAAGRADRVSRHSHDFWEVMLVVAGDGWHHVGRETLPLVRGDVVLVRPDDAHTISGGDTTALQFINVAFPSATFTAFAHLADLQGDLEAWLAARTPPSRHLAPVEERACLLACHALLRGFVDGPTRFELLRFWSHVVPLFLTNGSADVRTPAWLSSAVREFERPENLALGLPRLVALCGVSPAYLSRTVRAVYGVTPTTLVNDRRLRRAAHLLATTSSEVLDVAAECGFDNVSYFYRLFTARFGQPPRAWREAGRSNVAPRDR